MAYDPQWLISPGVLLRQETSQLPRQLLQRAHSTHSRCKSATKLSVSAPIPAYAMSSNAIDRRKRPTLLLPRDPKRRKNEGKTAARNPAGNRPEMALW